MPPLRRMLRPPPRIVARCEGSTIHRAWRPVFLLALQLAQLDESHGRHDGVVEGVVGFALG